jgi:hypothetical protein
MEQTYNGWTNYATWRVMLEIFDGRYPLEIFDGYAYDQEGAEHTVTADECESYVSEILDVSSDVGSGFDLVRSYADAFLNEVNWYEIANHINDDIEEEARHKEISSDCSALKEGGYYR